MSNVVVINNPVTLTGPLNLTYTPNNPNDAVNKGYVDNYRNNLQTGSISASSITTGTLAAARMPAFNGDLTSSAGSTVLTLTTTGVTPGTYTKVTVNSKGRVIGGSTLAASDIPNLDWSKITTGKPTTLSGYGITNAVSISGGTVTGNITLASNPTDANHVATKQYVDSVVPTGGNGVPTGGIVIRNSSLTPSGYLRCNGAEVNKTTYSGLYNVVGDQFGYELHPGFGQPWIQQYNINTEQSGDITGWTTTTSIPQPLVYTRPIVTKNRVYLLGGSNGSSYLSTVYTAVINNDGTLGSWSTSTSLPAGADGSQGIVTKNRVYYLGGWNGGPTSQVFTASINSDGTLGSWSNGPSLPTGFNHSQAIITKNRVYLIGGEVGHQVSMATVYTAPINSDGTLGSWSTGTSLPIPLAYSQAIVTKNRVYLLGGASNGTSVSTVYTTTINNDGTLGSWSTATPLPGVLSSSQAIVTKNRVYLLGGNIGNSRVSTVYTASINSDGTLGSWTTGTSLPQGLHGSRAIVTKNRVYLLGGWNSSGNVSSTVYTTSILGGLNDYSPYYDGTYSITDPNNFKLPDLTHKESYAKYFFIKT